MDVRKILALPEGPLQTFLDISPPLAPSRQLQLAVEDDGVAVHAPDGALALLDPASTTHLSGCIRCHKPGMASCSGCHAARYCSRECQVADRPYHKRLCNQQVRFDEANRPSPRHIRCVLMAVGQPGPDFTWVECDAEGRVLRSHLESTLGYGSAGITLLQTNREGTTYKPPYFTAFVGSKNELTDPVNRAFLRIMGRPGQAFPKRGNMLHMAFSAPTAAAQQQACQPRDATMFDWSEAVTFFHTDVSTPLVIDPVRFTGPAVPSIKLNCHGDCARYKIATTEKGNAPLGGPTHKLYHWVSPYAVMLQLPWVSRWAYMNVDLVTTSPAPKSAQRNDQATFLDACAKFCPSTGAVDHIVHEPFGGTQLLFHTAGAEVHPHHLTAFNRFLARIIPAEQNRISHIAVRPGDITLAELRSRATRTEFAAFWEEYVAGLDRETDSQGTPASPYDATPGPHAQDAGIYGAENRARIEAAWRGNERPDEQQPEQHPELREVAALIAAELGELLPGVNVMVNFRP